MTGSTGGQTKGPSKSLAGDLRSLVGPSHPRVANLWHGVGEESRNGHVGAPIRLLDI